MHFDGQPVEPTKWFQDDPFLPVLKEQRNGEWKQVSWDKLENGYDDDLRVFARSASDDKGPIIMFLQAFDIMKSRGQSRNSISRSF